MGPQRSIKLRLAGGKKEGNICLPQEELTTTVCTVVQTDKTSLGEDMLPRAVAGDQLVGDLPSMHEALVQPPAPHKPGMGVQACELALGDEEKKDYKFKVIQGLDYSRPCFRDSKKEKGMRRGQRGSLLAKLRSTPCSAGTLGRVDTATPFYTGLPLCLHLPPPLLCQPPTGLP